MAAKKSNKTEHVLKLITKNEEASREDDFFDIQTSPEPQPDERTEKIKVEIEAKAPEAPVMTDTAPVMAPVQEPVQETQLKEPVPEIQQKAPEPEVEQVKEPPTLRAFREQESSGGIVLEQNEDLVNIAEVLAKEKLAIVMERMKVCKCKTCVNDVLALALNSLPTKYVTTDAGRQYFQLDVYKKQYETEILAALTKACVRVKASPRH